MDELIQRWNEAGIRYLLVGGQALRLPGMPRFTMDWDFYIPGRDPDNFRRLNEPLVPLGPMGENFVQTYQTRGTWGVAGTASTRYRYVLPRCTCRSVAMVTFVQPPTTERVSKVRTDP